MKKRVKVRQRYFKKKSAIKFYLISALLAIILGGVSVWFLFEVNGQKAADTWIDAKSAAANNGQISLPKDDALIKNKYRVLDIPRAAYHRFR